MSSPKPHSRRKTAVPIVGDAKQGQKIQGSGLNGTPTPNPGLSKAQKNIKKPGQGSRGITDTGTRNEGAQTRPKTTVPKPGQASRGTTDTGTGNLNPQNPSSTKAVLRKAFNEKKSATKGKGAGMVVSSGGVTSNKKSAKGSTGKNTSNKKKKKG